MKKLFSLILTVVFLFLCNFAYADVGCFVNGALNRCSQTTDINWLTQTGSAQVTQTGLRRNIPVLDSGLFAAGVAQGDATSIPSTTNAVPTGYAFVRVVANANGDPLFNAKTLANGLPGQILTIYVAGLSSGGSTGGSFTITPTLSTGWSTVKLSAINDILTLQFVDTTVGWVITEYTAGASNSITITLKN